MLAIFVDTGAREDYTKFPTRDAPPSLYSKALRRLTEAFPSEPDEELLKRTSFVDADGNFELQNFDLVLL